MPPPNDLEAVFGRTSELKQSIMSWPVLLLFFLAALDLETCLVYLPPPLTLHTGRIRQRHRAKIGLTAPVNMHPFAPIAARNPVVVRWVQGGST